MAAGEFGFITWLRSRTPANPRVIVGPGDDCAVLEPPVRPLLVTTDLLTDGVDFVLAEAGMRRAGRKAMGANLSDIAAMAGIPVAAVVGVVVPRNTPSAGMDALQDLHAGLHEMADAFGMPIVGGDTNSWNGPFVISVTVFGEATERGPVLRSGAKPGDWLIVTGPCGGSILGRHLEVAPRVTEALALHAAADLHAMIDVSDGLAADLNHILEESGCGAVVSAEAIPIHPDAIENSKRSGKSPLQHALGDGEDFELVFAVSPADGERLVRERPELAKIGECVENGLWIEEDGTRRPLQPTGPILFDP
jgi:thiamine-monophosphate kinase